MANFGMDEDDELAAVKEWWRKNGLSLVIGVVAGVAAIAAWQGWQAWQEHQALQASQAYSELLQVLASESVKPDKLVTMVEQIQADFSDSPYAAHAGLRLAAYFVARGKPARARQALQWVVKHAKQAPLRHIARVRQARTLWAQGKSEAALDKLSHQHPPAFTSLYAELTGDIHAAAGNLAAARQAYRRALDNLPRTADPGPLKRKLNSVSGGAPDKQMEVS